MSHGPRGLLEAAQTNPGAVFRMDLEVFSIVFTSEEGSEEGRLLQAARAYATHLEF